MATTILAFAVPKNRIFCFHIAPFRAIVGGRMNEHGPRAIAPIELQRPCIVAFALRFLWLVIILWRNGPRALMRPDTLSYWIPGQNLLFHGKFLNGHEWELIRTPGYPLFLAILGQIGPATVALGQILLGVASVWLLGRLATRMLESPRAGWWAAMLLAIDPLSVTSSIPLLSEPLAVFLTVAALERFSAAIEQRRVALLGVAGVLLAASALVRPVGYFLPICLSLYLLLLLRDKPRLRSTAPLLLLICAMLPLVGWQIRNHLVAGWGGFSAVSARNLYFYNAAEVESVINHRSLAAEQDALGYHDSRFDLTPQNERWEWMQKRAMEAIGEHPLLAAQLSLTGSLRSALNPGAATAIALWSGAEDDEAQRVTLAKGYGIAFWWSLLHQAILLLVRLLFAAWILGLYFLIWRGRRVLAESPAALLLFGGVVLYFLLLGGGAAGSARMRMQAMPALVALASAGLPRRIPLP